MQGNPDRSRAVTKVAAYITWHDRLLVFRQPASPEAGVQVPAGTLEPGEAPAHAVLREAREETGLACLRPSSYLGQNDSTFKDGDGQTVTVHRHFYHLRFCGQAPERWQHWESTPSGGVTGPILFELWWASYQEAEALLLPWFAVFLCQIQSELRSE